MKISMQCGILLITFILFNGVSGDYTIRTRTAGSKNPVKESDPLVIYLYNRPPYFMLDEDNRPSGIFPNLVQVLQNRGVIGNNVSLVPVKDLGSEKNNENSTTILGDLKKKYGHFGFAPGAFREDQKPLRYNFSTQPVYYLMIRKDQAASFKEDGIFYKALNLIVTNDTMGFNVMRTYTSLDYLQPSSSSSPSSYNLINWLKNSTRKITYVENICEGMKRLGVVGSDGIAKKPDQISDKGVIDAVLVTRSSYLYYSNEFVTFRSPEFNVIHSGSESIYYAAEFHKLVSSTIADGVKQIPKMEFDLALVDIDNGGRDQCLKLQNLLNTATLCRINCQFYSVIMFIIMIVLNLVH